MVLKTADSVPDDLSEGVVFAEDLPLGGQGIEFGEALEIEDPRQAQAKEKEKQALSVRQLPARVARNLGYGVAGLAEGLFDPFAGLGKALSTSGDIKQLMGVMKDPEASRERKVRAYDQIRELEKLHLSDNRTYAGYRTLEDDVRKRMYKGPNNPGDPRVINALNDLKAVTSAFPMLFSELGRAIVSENPEAARSLGLMITAEGIGSAVSTMDPRNFMRNMEVMPFSTALSMVPVARVIAKSPALLSRFRGKYKRFDEVLDALDDIDRGARGAFESIGDIRVGGAMQSIPILKQLEAGITPRKVLDIGKQQARGKGPRISSLRPEDRLKNIRDFGDKVIKGAQVGFLAGVPIEAGLVYAAGYGLFQNKLTRHHLAALDQWVRHTSAQAGAAPELAVRAIMMASARDRAEIRAQANKLAKLFEEGKGFGADGDGVSLAMSNRLDTLAKYTDELDSSVRAVPLKNIVDQIESMKKSLEDDFYRGEYGIKQDFTPKQRAQQLQQLDRLERLVSSQVADGPSRGAVTLSTGVGTILDEIDQLAQARGVSKELGNALRKRVADAAGQSGLLLQAPEVARQVVNVLSSQYGIPKKAASEFVANYGHSYAKNPAAIPSNKIVANTSKGQNVIDLDQVVRDTVGGMDQATRNRIMGQVVSAETIKMGGLVSNAAWNQALRAEAGLGPIISRNLERLGKDTDVFKAAPSDYANAFLMSMFRKDMSGSMRVPQVIPANVMGNNGADLANAIRTSIVSDDGIRQLARQAGITKRLTDAEVANFRSSMTEVSDRLRSYVDQSGDSSARANISRALDVEGNVPPEMRNLAKAVNEDGVYVAKGLANTMSWHNRTRSSIPIMSQLSNLFGRSRFKAMATVYNPVAHKNNTLGNLGLMLVRWGEDPLTFTQNAVRDWRTYSDFNAGRLTPYQKMERGTSDYYRTRAAGIQDKAGVANSDFVAGELMLMEQAGVVDTGLTKSAMAKIREKLAKYPRKAYSAEDNIPKLRFGMKYAQQFLEDVDNLKPGADYSFMSSPVSRTTLYRGKDGQIYKRGSKKALTDADIDNLAATYTRRQVSEHFLAYNETSGLNRMVNESGFLSTVSPFFTFFHKAMGFGGTKGFLRNALDGTDGIVSTDPRVISRQLKDQAQIAARRAYLVNSFKQLTSREEDMLARAFAYESKVPSSVIFDVLADEDTVSYKDLTSMNAFAPAEARMRASLYVIGNIMKTAGYTKTKEQKRFLKELDKGNVGGLELLSSIVGLGRSPIEDILGVIRQGSEKRLPEATSAEVLEKLIPISVGTAVATPLKEALAQLDDSAETLSGVREVAGAPNLSESRKEYLIRRFIGGGRKQGFMAVSKANIAGKKQVTSQSLLNRRLDAIKTNARQLERVLKAKLVRLTAQRDKFPQGSDKYDEANLVVDQAQELFLNEKARVEKIVDDESLRLREAFEFVTKVQQLRKEKR